MKRYIFLFGFVLMATGGDAQEKQPRYNPVGNIFFQDFLKGVSENPLNLEYVPIKNYTASTLFYRKESGSLKQGGMPESVAQYGIEAQGLYKNTAKTVFFGSLSIEKSYYEKLKWNLSYQLPENGLMPDPHYFGVSKGADWSNQEYEISGGFLWPAGNRISLLLKIDYDLFNKYRSDFDPRPKITFNELDLEGGIHYLLNSQHHLKIAVMYGHTDVSNEIEFSNKDKNIPYNYDIYVKWIGGYGSLFSPFKNETQRKFTTTGLNLGMRILLKKTSFMPIFFIAKKNK